ncbi:MAG: ATP-binding cassette domain-containing protein [Calditrichia bacterium]
MNYEIQISKRGKTIVEIENFSLPEDKIVLLFGESGIGKSILTRAVYGLLDPNTLDITINGHTYHEYLKNSIAQKKQEHGFFVFQEPSSHLNPLLLLKEQLNEGALAPATNEAEVLKQLWNTENQEPIQELLDIFPRPYRPSGGEKQRMLLTMAFKKLSTLQNGQDGELFVFDEPTGSLDNNFRNIFLKMLFDAYRKTPFSGLIITHDYSIITEIYQQHPDLKSDIAFKELTRQQKLQMTDFEPAAYLSWLRTAAADTPSSSASTNSLLRIESGYRVFDKTMRISKSNSETVCPLTLHGGEIVYVKAASGVGKTTLAKIAMGLTRAQKVQLMLSDISITEKTPETLWRKQIWGRQAGMVFQHADEALNLNATVSDVFNGLPKELRLSDSQLKAQLEEWFQMSVTDAFWDKPVKLLSGGQKQRLNLLRTFCLDTPLLILDEPLNGLDFKSIQRIIVAMQQATARGKGILLISHNEEIFDTLIPSENVYNLTISE